VTKLLVVDDSPLMRRLLGDIFGEAGFDVTVARNGAEAIEQLHAVRPDVVTLDIQMPGMSGLACLDRIMLERPTPVVMLSSVTEEGARETLDALDLGAVDFMPKPGGAISLGIETLAPRLVARVRAAADARLPSTLRLAERIRFRSGATTRLPAAAAPAQPRAGASLWRAPPEGGVVLVGTSTGGPPALEALLAPLPAAFPWPIVIAQHMPASFTGQLARRLDRLCAITVEEVSRPVALEPGHAYIGRGDADVLVGRRKSGLVALSAPASEEHLWHPSVDRLVESAMDCLAPERLVGVLMTGMGSDGARTMTQMQERGGLTIAEAKESAVVWGMPGALVAAGGAGRIVALEDIAGELAGLVPAR
jgi:two-component system chemotaxis response regulator CheB